MARSLSDFDRLEKFWKNVDQRGPGDCWPWKGGKGTNGYGYFYTGHGMASVHRIMWYLIHGELPPSGLFVCHHCDNRACVNPTHLFLGTNEDNMKDAREKERMHRKISNAQRKEIRQLHNTGKYTQKELALRYGIRQTTISDIVNKARWYKHG